MFEIEKLIEGFYLVAGKEGKDDALIKNLGLAAIEEVKSNLSTGVDLEDGQHNLLMLCVALMFYQYALIETQNQAESVRVGDVSVSNSNNKQTLLDAAKQLKQHYLHATRRYMKAKFVEFKMI
ncbi:hypothetical protein FACS189481_5400 [Clostridia bacterium]|nr:hypothetical protein FACS189481_5400 [Clostridia bacterium]